MAFKLRFVQTFRQGDREEFLRLERLFAKLEQENPEFPQGERMLPFAGKEAENTLVWECTCSDLAAALAALEFLKQDPRHEELYRQQSRYFINAYTELYEILEA